MNDEYEEIKRMIKAFDRNLSRIERFLEAKLKEESIILIVSTFEAFLRDLFVLKRSRWFDHTQEGGMPRMITSETRKIIRKYLQDIRAYNEFLGIRYVYSHDSPDDPDIMSLYEVLFKSNTEKINFQNLKDSYGAKVAYKTFFDIDLVKSLDENNSTSDRMWEKLIGLFAERHEIIHRGKETTFSQEDIRTILKAIEYLKADLVERLGTYRRKDGTDVAITFKKR
jgi:hypothetical protein